MDGTDRDRLSASTLPVSPHMDIGITIALPHTNKHCLFNSQLGTFHLVHSVGSCEHRGCRNEFKCVSLG